MSPPCVGTIFKGDNRGATSIGVSATEIRVGMPVPSWFPGIMPANRTVAALFEHINQRYEFYGRRLVPVYTVGSADSAATARTLAAQVASERVFAALTGVEEYNTAQLALPQELARQQVVTVVRAASSWWFDRTLYDAMHPFVWSVYPSAEDVQANLVDFVCSSLAGRPAAHAGDAGLQGKPRRFGIVSFNQQVAPSISILRDGLAACSDDVVPTIELVSANGGSSALRAGVESLRDRGATTLFCVCEAGFASNPIAQTHTAGFHPEWILTPTYYASGNDEHWLQAPRRSNHLAPPMRVSAGPKLLPIQARPWYGAVQPTGLFDGVTSGALYDILGMAELVYPELLTLAAGIQAAGPVLTPDTFAAGLMATQFGNPGAGEAPYWQPSVGFGPGDHSLYDDYNVAWWSDEAPALDGVLSTFPTGSWCYLGQGERYRVGAFPADADAAMFSPAVACR